MVYMSVMTKCLWFNECFKHCHAWMFNVNSLIVDIACRSRWPLCSRLLYIRRDNHPSLFAFPFVTRNRNRAPFDQFLLPNLCLFPGFCFLQWSRSKWKSRLLYLVKLTAQCTCFSVCLCMSFVFQKNSSCWDDGSVREENRWKCKNFIANEICIILSLQLQMKRWTVWHGRMSVWGFLEETLGCFGAAQWWVSRMMFNEFLKLSKTLLFLVVFSESTSCNCIASNYR